MLSEISSSFESSDQVSWIGTAFSLTLASCTPIYGRLCDIIGRRAANLTALGLFTVGNLSCGLAPNMTWLILSRAVAGAGAGGIFSTASIVANDLIPLRKRALVQGFANLFYGLGASLGGPVAGIIAARLGWRAAFYIQVPILLVSVSLVAVLVRYKVPGSAQLSTKSALSRIDWKGSLFLISGVRSQLGSGNADPCEDGLASVRTVVQGPPPAPLDVRLRDGTSSAGRRRLCLPLPIREPSCRAHYPHQAIAATRSVA
jgi:MFS family permease